MHVFVLLALAGAGDGVGGADDGCCVDAAGVEMQIEAASPSSSEKKSPPCRSSVLLMAANMVALEPNNLIVF